MERKNVLAIQGSYRKHGKTTSMLSMAASLCEKKGHNVTYINLFEKNIEYCKGCKKCNETGECILKNDDMMEITKQIKAADVILLAAPVYWANVPGIVKNLMDRLTGVAMEETSAFPKPRLSGKRYILFTACNTQQPFAYLAGQLSGLNRAVKEFFKTAGVKRIGMVACSSQRIYVDVPNKCKKKIEKLIEEV